MSGFTVSETPKFSWRHWRGFGTVRAGRVKDANLTDYQPRAIRLTEERQAHILEHPEMQGQEKRIRETLAQPEFVVATPTDTAVHVYGRFYETIPVTSKYLQVVVKLRSDDAFVLTAYYSSRPKRGRTVWPE